VIIVLIRIEVERNEDEFNEDSGQANDAGFNTTQLAILHAQLRNHSNKSGYQLAAIDADTQGQGLAQTTRASNSNQTQQHKDILAIPLL
jgi:hypothetical protein